MRSVKPLRPFPLFGPPSRPRERSVDSVHSDVGAGGAAAVAATSSAGTLAKGSAAAAACSAATAQAPGGAGALGALPADMCRDSYSRSGETPHTSSISHLAQDKQEDLCALSNSVVELENVAVEPSLEVAHTKDRTARESRSASPLTLSNADLSSPGSGIPTAVIASSVASADAIASGAAATPAAAADGAAASAGASSAMSVGMVHISGGDIKFKRTIDSVRASSSTANRRTGTAASAARGTPMDSEGGTSASVMGIDSAASIGDEEAVESNSAEHPSSRRRMVSPVALSFAGAADTTPPAPEQPASAHLAAAPQQQQSPSQVISTPSPAPAPVPAPAAAPASTPAESKTEAVSSVQNDEAAALAASIALARQLMQEESMHVYAQLQHETLMVQREIAMQHANQGIEASEEDADLLYALELAQQEQEAAQHGIADDEDFDTDNMDYDQLMQLGSRMGDVAQQRWELDSKNVIQQLPRKRLTEQDIKERTDAAKSNGAGSKLALVVEDPTKCLICQCEYEADECVRQLPCGHEFHMGCVDQWLSGSKTCPVCKASVDVAAQDSAPDAVAGGGEQKQ